MKTYDFNLLRTLDALMRTGSVTAAAQELHLSVPATSHALARLREAMGDPLLVRAGRKLTPTPRALALQPQVRVLLEQLKNLAAQQEVNFSTLERHFVLRAPDGLSVSIGPTLAIAMQAQLPRCTLEFLSEAMDEHGALREGRVDLDFGLIRVKDPEIETLSLRPQRWLGVASGHQPMPRDAQGKVSLDDFCARAQVMAALRAQESSAVDEALSALGRKRFVAMTVPNSFSALVVAANSGLLACLPDHTLQVVFNDPRNLKVDCFELPFDITPEPRLIAWHPRHTLDPAHQWLRQTLREALTEHDSLNWPTRNPIVQESLRQVWQLAAQKT